MAGLEFREVMSVTRAQGGIATNVIPARFDLNLNYRFPPSLTPGGGRGPAAGGGGPGRRGGDLRPLPGGGHPRGQPAPGAPGPDLGARRTGKQGWTDVARLTRRGIPAVNYGPGEVALCHRPDESVAVAAMETAFADLKRFLTEG